MQLAKIRLADGREAVGWVEADSVAVLAPSAEFPSLASILEAADPAEVVPFLGRP